MARLTWFRAIVAAAVMVGVAVAVWVTWPATSGLRTAAQMDNATTELLETAGGSGQSNLAKEWLRRIPATSNGSVAAAIAQTANKAGMSNVNVEVGPRSTVAVSTFAGVVPVTMDTYTLTAAGELEQVAQFLSSVGELTPMVSVTDAELGTQVSMQLVSYTAPLAATVESLR